MATDAVRIEEGTISNRDDALAVERAAFGSEVEAQLVRDLLEDDSAQPAISLLARHEGQAVGHVLFTRARVEPEAGLSAYILAPLAVVPNSQKQGIGGRLIEHGLQLLTQSSVDLVFVLGDPGYYQRHGFRPAGVQGFAAPYPIPDEHADCWMVQELRPGVQGSHSGRVVCADALDEPELWRE